MSLAPPQFTGERYPDPPEAVAEAIEHLFCERELPIRAIARHLHGYDFGAVRHYLIANNLYDPRIGEERLAARADDVEASLNDRPGDYQTLYPEDDPNEEVLTDAMPETGVNTAAVENADPSRGPHCVKCGADVSKPYARVFGNGHAVNGCADCHSRSERY